MGTLLTPLVGLPYPDPNELVSSGDDAIGALGAKSEQIFATADSRQQSGGPSASTSIPSGQWVKCSTPQTDWASPVPGSKLSGDSSSLFVYGGTFAVFLSAYWSSTASGGRRLLGIYFSSSDTGAPIDTQGVIAGAAAGLINQREAMVYKFPAGTSRVGLFAYQDSGSALTIAQRTVTVVRLSPGL